MTMAVINNTILLGCKNWNCKIFSKLEKLLDPKGSRAMTLPSSKSNFNLL